MVVYLPQIEGEKFKVCPCGAIGITSPVKERSSYYPLRSRGRKHHFESRCRDCARRRSAESKRRRQAKDPEGWRKKQQRHQREFRERHLERLRREDAERARRRRWEDPEFRQRQIDATARYKARVRKDPVRREAALERDRMNHRLRLEREEGKVLAVEDKKLGHSGIRLPIGPFKEWLEGLIEEAAAEIPEYADPARTREVTRKAVAARLDVSTRTLYRYLIEFRDVDESVVDRCVCRDGRLSLWDLYPSQLDYVPAQTELPLEIAA